MPVADALLSCVAVRLLHVGSEEEQQKVTLLVQSYAEHPAVLAARVVSSSPITGRSKSSTSQPFQHQLRLLTQRAFWQYSRQPVHIIARVAENRQNPSHTPTRPHHLHASLTLLALCPLCALSVSDAVHRPLIPAVGP